MTEDDAATLVVGDSVEYFDGQAWRWCEVRAPLRDIPIYPGRGVRVSNGTYETEARPRELRR